MKAPKEKLLREYEKLSITNSTNTYDELIELNRFHPSLPNVEHDETRQTILKQKLKNELLRIF